MLVLSNGDRLQGEFVREESDVVYFHSEILGEISLPKKQVSETVLEKKDSPQDVLPAESVQKPIKKKPALPEVQAEEKKKKLWSGYVGFAFNRQHAEYERRSGSGLNRHERDNNHMRLSGKLKWDCENHHLEWIGSYVYAQANEKKNNDLYDWTQRYRYDFDDRWFGQSETSYERDYVRILDREVRQSGGLGWYAVKTPELTVDVVPGVNYYYRDQADEQSEGVAPALQQSLTSKLSENLSFFQRLSYIGNLEQYYYRLNVGLNNRLMKDLFLRFEYRYEMDANVDDGVDPFIQRQVLSSLQYRF